MRVSAQIVYKFRSNPSCERGKVEEQNKALDSRITIINYYIIIVNAYYCYIVKAWYNYYISNKGLVEECVKEENVAVNGTDTAFCLTLKTPN